MKFKSEWILIIKNLISLKNVASLPKKLEEKIVQIQHYKEHGFKFE